MSNGPPLKFPNLYSGDSNDYNPAIRLYGSRFYNDQTLLEFLNEFLGLIYSKKRIEKTSFISPFIDFNDIYLLQEEKLSYYMPIKLNLKLFGLFSGSRIDGRHSAHERHYRKLRKTLRDHIESDSEIKDHVMAQIEVLLRSLVGAGFNRDWCAKNFFPLSSTLITRETIWNASKAINKDLSWDECMSNFKMYFSWVKRNFMARGGELLYLQLCNTFTQNEPDITKFTQKYGIVNDDKTLEKLHNSLQLGFANMQNEYIKPLDKLVNFIEMLDPDTNKKSNDKDDWQTCEWCPQESWKEGFLFAIELSKVLNATLDPVDRLEMLMTGCALQVLRSLCAQSVRYAGLFAEPDTGSALGYAWVFSHPQTTERSQRIVSQRNLLAVQCLIQKALRHESLAENAKKGPKGSEVYYREADSKYGHKLFLSLGKKLGIIVPLKGKGARFILTDKVVRYLILSVLPPGSQCTYDDFLKKIYNHFGIAVEGEQLNDAKLWSGLLGSRTVQSSSFSWLTEMLRAAGFLTELSDAFSIVNNPFGETE